MEQVEKARRIKRRRRVWAVLGRFLRIMKKRGKETLEGDESDALEEDD